ncbi:hypothetical protein GUITHDRAFT_132040 [Guillardia theta CCMP2712]|uniref:Uncharacterized protein n=1 Tax=Guillardia theta (strain CCMP2712) TaxID=905079 RepID=L1K1H9_GUITC|nr:hypothetical protein GUITHDRAFT_132040 [Guillardia theta CCMP2712]EKX54280.1 hypothetical protein GUITHDRAFT_132040 [Guillardia theta CCMP2712]|eukprot:XP_005841260.1 hypothetical protein GUITHDRAFT_132040 [Guillardia theta CCMP2712]
MAPVEAQDGLRVVGYNLPPRIGYKVKLTKQGEQSFDEVYHKISGGREGTITDVREDGQICTVRWAPGKFGRFELYCAADMEQRMSNPFERDLLKTENLPIQDSNVEPSLESLFGKEKSFEPGQQEDGKRNEASLSLLPSRISESLAPPASLNSKAEDANRPSSNALLPTFSDAAVTQGSSARTRYKNPLNKSSLAQSETISLSGSISNGGIKKEEALVAGRPPVKKLTIVDSPEVCRPADQSSKGSPDVKSPELELAAEKPKPQSLVSMVVKNPLRQGLEWAESKKVTEDQEHQQSQTDPSLMTILVKRPLRMGLELADTMTEQAQQDQRTSPSLISRVIKQPIRNSGLVMPEETSNGNQEPSLLTVVIKRPLQQFVWGPSGSLETGKDSKEDSIVTEIMTGVEQDDEHWNFGVPKQNTEIESSTDNDSQDAALAHAGEGQRIEGTTDMNEDGLQKIDEDMEYDPDTMMPVRKGPLGQDEEEEEMELDPDTLMPIPKKKVQQLQAAKLPNFSSFRARKLIGANTKPPTAKLITASVNGEVDDMETLDDTASVFSSSTRVSEAALRAQIYATIPRNDELPSELTQTFENVRKLNSSTYSPGNKLMGGLDSFEGHLRASTVRRSAAVKPAKAKDPKDTDHVEEIVEGVSKFFNSHRNTEW